MTGTLGVKNISSHARKTVSLLVHVSLRDSFQNFEQALLSFLYGSDMDFDLIHLIRSTHLSAFRPLSGKEENTLRSKRQSLLSEVIFIQAATTSSSESSGGSPTEKNR